VSVCGDSVLRNDLAPQHANFEECDDGNVVAGDACSNVCTLARCGDGIVQIGVETCDDGNSFDTDGCLGNCQPSRCGDGVQRQDIGPGMPGYEACDDGNQSDNDGCSNACALNNP
jgi:cysteine-rich repeat protein